MVHLVTVPFGDILHPAATSSVAVRSRLLEARTDMFSHAANHYLAVPGQFQTRFFTYGAKCEFKSLQGVAGGREPENGLCLAGSLKIPWMRRLLAVRIAGRDRLVVLGLRKEHIPTLGIFRFD
jgi:hypothetical protein